MTDEATSLIIAVTITCDLTRCRRRREIFKRESYFLLKLLFTLCCIVGVNCEPRRGIKELQAALAENRVPPPFFGHCDFESPCRSWNFTNEFREITKNTPSGTTGHFLLLEGYQVGQIWSIIIPPTGAQCFLKFSTHQVHMRDGVIRLIIVTNNITSSVALERSGNNDAKLVSM